MPFRNTKRGKRAMRSCQVPPNRNFSHFSKRSLCSCKLICQSCGGGGGCRLTRSSWTLPISSRTMSCLPTPGRTFALHAGKRWHYITFPSACGFTPAFCRILFTAAERETCGIGRNYASGRKRASRAMSAVSVRRMRGPSDWRRKPFASSSSTSSSVQPPSGPTASSSRSCAA